MQEKGGMRGVVTPIRASNGIEKVKCGFMDLKEPRSPLCPLEYCPLISCHDMALRLRQTTLLGRTSIVFAFTQLPFYKRYNQGHSL